MTGVGEGAIRLALAKTACDLIKGGLTPQRAANLSVDRIQKRLGMKIGMVKIDVRGRIGSAHSTPDLCWAFVNEAMPGPRFAMK